MPVEPRTPAQWRRARIRTFHGRHGRLSPRLQEVLAAAGSRHGLDARPAPAHPLTRRPLILEVGGGDGSAARACARAHPEIDLLAVDVHAPGVARLLDALDTDPLPNLFVEHTDALDLLEDRLSSGGLDGIHLFFPDPWPKARHHKRRFVRPDVLDLVADRLRPDARLLFATDHAPYAAWAGAHLDAHDAFSGGRTRRPDWRPRTRYERSGLDAGRTIVELDYRRLAEPGDAPNPATDTIRLPDVAVCADPTSNGPDVG